VIHWDKAARRDGREIRVAKRNVAIPMLAYLLLHRDRAVAREFLAHLTGDEETMKQ
jgi:hypothetical protein